MRRLTVILMVLLAAFPFAFGGDEAVVDLGEIIDEAIAESTEEITDEAITEITGEITGEIIDEVIDEAADEIADEVIAESTDEIADEAVDLTPDEPAGPSRGERLSAMSREELFRRAFRRDAPERPRHLAMRLFDGDSRQTLGTTEIVWEEDFSSFRFVSPHFERYLDRQLLPAARHRAGDSIGYFCSKVLSAAGYLVNADENAHELRITPPFMDKVPQRLLLGTHRGAPLIGTEISPALFSFYMNYRLDGRLTYTVYDFDSSYTGRRPGGGDTLVRSRSILDFEGAFASMGWVLEGSGMIREPAAGQPLTWDALHRGSVRLVRDIHPWMARFTAGDVDIYSEIIGGEIVGGVRYEQNDRMFGNDPRDGTDVISFFLPKPGYVLLYIDGRYIERIDLPAGHHDISGLDTRFGSRNVRLYLVTLEDRAAERVDFKYVHSSARNMFKGEKRYSMTAGFRRGGAPAPRSYSYNFREPALHGDIMYGVGYAVSAGVAGMFSRDNGAAGAQLLWDMSNFGWLDLRTSVSYTAYERFGERVDISYSPRLQRTIDGANRLLTSDTLKQPLAGLSLTFRGYYSGAAHNTELFGPIDPTGGTIGTTGFSGNLGFRLFRMNVSATGGADYGAESANSEEYSLLGYTYGMRLARSIRKAAFNASAGIRVRNGVRTPYFAANSNYSIGASVRRHRFSVGGDVGTRAIYPPPEISEIEYPDSVLFDPDFDGLMYDTVMVPVSYDWSYGAVAGWRWANHGSGVSGAQTYTANASLRNGNTPVYSASADYFHNRAQFRANYNFTESDLPGLYSRGVHSFRGLLTGSFMFADGLWALGRQVNNGFTLIDTRGNMSGANVHVNRSHHTRRDMSRSGLLGAAYHNRVSEHDATGMRLALTNVPFGALMEQNRYYTIGAYKQGYALRIGGDTRTLLQVRLTDGEKPLSHTYLTIEPDDDHPKNRAFGRRASFTNSSGILQISDLVPGTAYRVKFSSSSHLKDIQIEIPKDAAALLELPDITVVGEGE
jgi:outer membrane usher protein FimD/PapC